MTLHAFHVVTEYVHTEIVTPTASVPTRTALVLIEHLRAAGHGRAVAGQCLVKVAVAARERQEEQSRIRLLHTERLAVGRL